MLDRARQRHGDKVDYFREAFSHEDRSRLIHSRRNNTQDPDLRFLLALLLNAVTPQQIHSLVSQRFGSERIQDRIAEWVGRLLAEENQRQLTPTVDRLLRYMLRGLTPAAISDKMHQDGVPVAGPILDEMIFRLEQNELLKPLLAAQ